MPHKDTQQFQALIPSTGVSPDTGVQLVTPLFFGANLLSNTRAFVTPRLGTKLASPCVWGTLALQIQLAQQRSSIKGI